MRQIRSVRARAMIHLLCTASAAALAAALVSSAALVAIAAPPPAAAPGDGTYAYSVIRGAQKVGDSTVTVKRVGRVLSVHEVETFVGITDTVDATFDAADMSPTTYTSSFPLTPEVGITAHLDFTDKGARETVDGTSGATDFRLETGTTRLVVIDGAMMTGFLVLPAQVKALALGSFTALSPSRADTYDCRVETGAAPTRPPTVSPADLSLAVNGASRTGTASFVEWYDPKTMVVDEVDVPAQLVTIVRKARI